MVGVEEEEEYFIKRFSLHVLPRIDQDRGTPRAHLKNPSRGLHARAEAVPADRRGSAEEALPGHRTPTHRPQALPQMPQNVPKPESGGRKPDYLPNTTDTKCPHLSGKVGKQCSVSACMFIIYSS